MAGVLKRQSQHKAAAFLLIAALLLPVCWRQFILRHSRSTQFQVIEELGSILVFAGHPLVDNSCSRLIYIQYMTNDAWGIYLQELSTGRRALIDVLSTDTWREGVVYEQLRTIGWSPDDKLFAYCRNRHKRLLIRDISSGKKVATFELAKPMVSGAWLSCSRLLCSDGQQILEFDLIGAQWTGPKLFEPAAKSEKVDEPSNNQIESLQTSAFETVLWKKGNALWINRGGTTESSKLWENTTNTLLEYSYSHLIDTVLLHCRDDSGEFIGNLYIGPLKALGPLTNVERLDCREGHPTQLCLINDGRGYAFVNESDFSLNTPVIRPYRSQQSILLPWRGEIKSFAVIQEELFVIGSLTNEPAGIWKYNIISGKLQLIVSNQKLPFKYATSQPPLQNTITNALGKRLTYYMLQPAQGTNGTRPLVLGVMGNMEKAYTWDRYAQTVANCGCYFVTVDRRGSEFSEWSDEVLAVYDNVTSHNNIDKSKTYILGVSVGALVVNDVLRRRPQLCRGALYYSPTSFPNPAQLHVSRILIDIGELDEFSGQDNALSKQFRDAAAAHGMSVSLFIRPRVGHNCRILSIEKERLHQLALFIDNS